MPTRKDKAFQELLDFIKQSRGFDFTAYKPSSLMRRIQKRMGMLGIESYADYLVHLEVHPDEFSQLFNTILINVTGFFRDPAAWQYIAEEAIPSIISQKEPEEPIRIWSTGCATGEEAYSAAILLSEALGEDQYRERVKIYATDVDEDALNKARFATYTEKSVEGVPEEMLSKYFDQVGGNYTIDKELRRAVIFGRNDLIQDAPISRVDLLICRNTLMYFNAEAQSRILARFHFALRNYGYLFLGKAETLLTHGDLFRPADLMLRIFNKVPKVNLRERLLIMAQTGQENGASGALNHVIMRDRLFDGNPVAQIVVDADNRLLLANEQARKLFDIKYNQLGQLLQDMELSYHPVELRTPIQRARQERTPIIMKDIEWRIGMGERRFFELRIQPILDNGNGLLGVGIMFVDITSQKILQQKLEESNQELETAMEELQSTNEELETTNEELQSTNEELETTNEELQSTNEELETMNEELQATNEELQTLNQELVERTEELDQVNEFMESILNSLQAGVLVVDQQLNVQVWNRKMEDMWGLRQDEVSGLSMLNLDIGLPVERLKVPFWEALRSKDSSEQVQVLEARDRRGREVRSRVVSAPLVYPGHDIRGVIAVIENTDPTRERVGDSGELDDSDQLG